MVVNEVLFHLITDPLIKLVPVTVKVNAEPPAVAEEGDRVVAEGTGLPAALMVNVNPLEVPPPGVGLVTVTVAVPAVAILAAGILAVTCVALT